MLSQSFADGMGKGPATRCKRTLSTSPNQIAVAASDWGPWASSLLDTEQEVQSLIDQIGSRPTPDVESFAARFAQLEQSLAAIADRLGRLEQNVVALDEQAAESRDRVESDIRRIENQLVAHASILESSRTAVAQTDDLVERVVEALESLQSTVLEQPQARPVGVN